MKSQPSRRFGRLAAYLYVFIAILLVCHWITVFLTIDNPSVAASPAAVWFDLDREYNIPTVTNSLLLWSCAVTFSLLGFRARRRALRGGWLAFAVLFAYLGLDELLIFHEQLAEPVRELLGIGNTNPFYHAWVVPGIFVAIGFGCLSWWIQRYFKQLEPCRDLLKLIVFLASGVISLEVIGTFVYANNAAYRFFMVPLEEVFELSVAAWILLAALKQQKAKA